MTLDKSVSNEESYRLIPQTRPYSLGRHFFFERSHERWFPIDRKVQLWISKRELHGSTYSLGFAEEKSIHAGHQLRVMTSHLILFDPLWCIWTLHSIGFQNNANERGWPNRQVESRFSTRFTPMSNQRKETNHSKIETWKFQWHFHFTGLRCYIVPIYFHRRKNFICHLFLMNEQINLTHFHTSFTHCHIH